MIKTTERGEFWRLLLPGTYVVKAKYENMESESMSVNVNKDVVPIVTLTVEPVTNKPAIEESPGSEIIDRFSEQTQPQNGVFTSLSNMASNLASMEALKIACENEEDNSDPLVQTQVQPSTSSGKRVFFLKL